MDQAIPLGNIQFDHLAYESHLRTSNTKCLKDMNHYQLGFLECHSLLTYKRTIFNGDCKHTTQTHKHETKEERAKHAQKYKYIFRIILTIDGKNGSIIYLTTESSLYFGMLDFILNGDSNLIQISNLNILNKFGEILPILVVAGSPPPHLSPLLSRETLLPSPPPKFTSKTKAPFTSKLTIKIPITKKHK